MYNEGQQFGLEFHGSYFTFNLGDGFQVYTEYRILAAAIAIAIVVGLAKRIIKNKRKVKTSSGIEAGQPRKLDI